MASTQHPRVFFIHAHKCAGTSFIELFRKAGFRFPKGHSGGKSMAFHAMFYEDIDQYEAVSSVDEADFFTTEWQVAPWMLDLPCFKFTVLRDPWMRYLSGYAYDKQCPTGPMTLARSILDYRSLPNYTKWNYYTRYFSGRPCMDCRPVGEEDADKAIAVLESLDAVLLLGCPDTYKALSKVGIDTANLQVKNARKAPFEDGACSFEKEFRALARYDYAVWNFAVDHFSGGTENE